MSFASGEVRGDAEEGRTSRMEMAPRSSRNWELEEGPVALTMESIRTRKPLEVATWAVSSPAVATQRRKRSACLLDMIFNADR